MAQRELILAHKMQDETEARAVLNQVSDFKTAEFPDKPIAQVRQEFATIFGSLCLATPPHIDHASDHRIGVGDGVDIGLRLYRPDSEKPLPVLLFFMLAAISWAIWI